MCLKYKKEAEKVKKQIQNIVNKHSSEIEDKAFLKELLDNKNKYKKVAAAYFIVKKCTGKTLYDVQIMAVMSMLDGCFIDVKTGEGKTTIIGAYCLVAEKPIHVITVNSYLAEEAIRQLGSMYSEFDISYTILTEENFMETVDMKKDVIYGTGASFAFKYIVKRFERDIDYALHTAVIDEADYILIDNATSAFNVGITEGHIDDISLRKQLLSLKFVEQINKIFSEANIITLNYDEVSEWVNIENDLTNTIFINKALEFIDFTQDIQDYVTTISQEYNLESSEALSFMFGIARAYHILEKNIDYIVYDDKIVLVDRHNGRLLPNSKHDFYLNQSMLLKESLVETEETKNIGKIANQVYFLKYKNLIGLSGSLLPVMNEISEIFKAPVLEIPKNKLSVINKSYHFTNNKNDALLSIIKSNVNKEKATLIICKSDKDAINISNFLMENGYENTLFNNTIESANEEEVVLNAGKNKKITVSTLLFGRGTDIIPDDDSIVLSVIMYEEFGCERANIQISGRTGRQGREGDVHILVSRQDEIFQYVDGKTNAKLNEKNFLRAIKKAISHIYCKEKSQRENSTYYAYYLDMIFESYYREIKESEFDDYFINHMEEIEQISYSTNKKEDASKLMMDEAKKVIDSILYLKK